MIFYPYCTHSQLSQRGSQATLSVSVKSMSAVRAKLDQALATLSKKPSPRTTVDAKTLITSALQSLPSTSAPSVGGRCQVVTPATTSQKKSVPPSSKSKKATTLRAQTGPTVPLRKGLLSPQEALGSTTTLPEHSRAHRAEPHAQSHQGRPVKPMPVAEAPLWFLSDGSKIDLQCGPAMSIAVFHTLVSMAAELIDTYEPPARAGGRRPVPNLAAPNKGRKKTTDEKLDEMKKYISDILFPSSSISGSPKSAGRVLELCVRLARENPRLNRRRLVLPGHGARDATFFGWFVEGLSQEGSRFGKSRFDAAVRAIFRAERRVFQARPSSDTVAARTNSDRRPSKRLLDLVNQVRNAESGMNLQVSIVGHQTVVSITSRLMDEVRELASRRRDQKTPRSRPDVLQTHLQEAVSYIQEKLFPSAAELTKSRYVGYLNLGVAIAQAEPLFNRRDLASPGYGVRDGTAVAWFLEGLAVEGDSHYSAAYEHECRAVFPKEELFRPAQTEAPPATGPSVGPPSST